MPRPTTLSIELLETFVLLIQHDGDAGQTARVLGINQPSMSKRLSHLNQSGEVLRRPWLVREGKTWLLTAEGQRVLPAVRELVERYHALYGYTRSEPAQPVVRFACGQTSATGLVRQTLARFAKQYPDRPLRISTMRGPKRVHGVASGALDLALVSRSVDDIAEISRIDLYVEELDRIGYSLVCGSSGPLAKGFRALPTDKPLTLTQACEFPLITPEPDSRTRRALDDALLHHAASSRPQLHIQTGGWRTIIEYVRDGHGVGVVRDDVITGLDQTRTLLTRPLSKRQMPAIPLNLIARFAQDRPDGLDLTDEGRAWREALVETLDEQRD